jgi:hypothetical protein
MQGSSVDDYPLYVRGCAVLGWTPLNRTEFDQLYTTYLKCKGTNHRWYGFFRGIVHAIYLGRKEPPCNLTPIVYLYTVVHTFLPGSYHRRMRIENQLSYLATAVTAGRNEDGDLPPGSVPARIVPPPSSRDGRAAQEFPV